MWFIYAFLASILWGLTYTIDEQLFKKISVFTSLGIACFFASVIMFLTAIYLRTFTADLGAIFTSKKVMSLTIFSSVTFILAEILIGFSITAKNATIAGLIEISYPLFIMIFSYMLFKENRINSITLIGGFLIFAGVFVIYYFNK